MKHLKILGLAAFAATALMAFVRTASADVLCKAAPNFSGECPTASGDYASGTTFKAKSTNPKLTVVGGVTAFVTCAESNVELKNTGTGSNTSGVSVPAEITDLTFTSDCTTAGGTSCTVSTTKGFTALIQATGDSGIGDITIQRATAIKIKVVCGGIFSCEFRTPEPGVTLKFTGGNPAAITAGGAVLEVVSGFGCGSEARWDADYTLTSPTALWVATRMD